MQHKKLNVEGGGISKDFRKGQKQGDLEIWDPVDQVLGEGLEGYGSGLAENMTHVKLLHVALRNVFEGEIHT